jgi:hypothetical protein
MPGRDGLELCRCLKTSQPSVVVALITASPSTATTGAAAEAGVRLSEGWVVNGIEGKTWGLHMISFQITCGFLEHKQILHLRFLGKSEYEELQQQLKARFARIDPDPQLSECNRYDLHNANLVCRNENLSPGDLLAVCLRAL